MPEPILTWLAANWLVALLLALAPTMYVLGARTARSKHSTEEPSEAAEPEWKKCQRGQRLLGKKLRWTNFAWEERIDDPILKNVACLAYDQNPYLRPMIDQVAELGTTVRWDELPPTTHALYLRQRNEIVLNRAFLKNNEPLAALAAVLAHEVNHAACRQLAVVGDGLQNEVDSFFWEAATWRLIEKEKRATPLTRELDQLVLVQQEGQLVQHVLLATAYQEDYLGRAVVNP